MPPRDNILHVVFVGQENGQYRSWHTKRFPDDSFSPPIDVLRDSGETSTGSVYDMPISASFCPRRGNRHPTLSELDEEILLTWYDTDRRSILVQEIVRTPQQWVPGRAASIYSNLMRAEPIGIEIKDTQGRDLGTTVWRTRVGLRPFSDVPP